MERNKDIQYLFQTSFSLWILSFTMIALLWAWILLPLHETSRRKMPSLNLKEL